MNENARKWVEALRSGEFQQTIGYLRRDDKFCCLGVACELYRRENGGEWVNEGFLGQQGHLPPAVRSWLGLRTDAGLYSDRALVNDNDERVSFTEMAATIESEPEGLFA